MQIVPTTDDLKQRGKWLIRGVIGMIVLAGIAMYMTFVFGIIPEYIDVGVYTNVINSQSGSCYRWCHRLRETALQPLKPHFRFLVEFEAKADSVELGSIDLNEALSFPYVLDSFWIDYKLEQVFSVNGIVPQDSLSSYAALKGKKRTLNRRYTNHRFSRTIGMVRYNRAELGNTHLLLVMRDIRPYYPMQAEAVVGLVLNAESFIEPIPSRLDSLIKAEMPTTFEWFTYPGEDSSLYDEFRLTTNLAYGLKQEQDTLWWFGNRTIHIKEHDYSKDSWNFSGMVREIEGTGLTFLVKSFRRPLERDPFYLQSIFIKWMAQVTAIAGLGAISFMGLFLFLTRRQSRRNRLALSHLAHSVKTPVARLKLNTDTLIEGRVSSEDEEIQGIRAVGKEVSRLDLAVRNAALSLEKGRLKLRMEECSLSQILLDCVEAWQLTFEKAGFPLKVDHLGAKLTGKFDRGMIAVMIDNLIDNGLHYTRLNLPNLPRNTAQVVVRMRHERGKAEVIVDDTGPGIEPSQRRRIFRRFYRGSDYALTSVSGVGLGLTLVRDIVHAHHGKIRIEENHEGGARFVMTFPTID